MSYFIRLTIEAVIFASLIYISCEGFWRAEHDLRQWFLERPADHTEYGRDSSFLRALLDIPAVFYITVAAVIYILYAGPFNKNFITFISSAVSALSLYYLFLITAHPFLQPCMCAAMDFPFIPCPDMVPVQYFRSVNADTKAASADHLYTFRYFKDHPYSMAPACRSFLHSSDSVPFRSAAQDILRSSTCNRPCCESPFKNRM